MTAPSQPHSAQNCPTSYYWSGEVIRSRSVSNIVLSDTVDVPAPPARLMADWEREISLHLSLEPGDVEALPLARARARWPDYRQCVQAVSEWTHAHGLHNVLASSDVALMACRGAKYHHDGATYGGFAFCNIFLSEDKGLDLHFAVTGHRIPLVRGTVVIFDTGQPHAVIQRHSSGFQVIDFPSDKDCSLVFLTWELPIEDDPIQHALGITLDVAPCTAQLLDKEQVWINGVHASVCPNSGEMR